jgi:hypothetical protein
MSESIRYESAERVRDVYRRQGKDRELQRIVLVIETLANDYPQSSQEFDILLDVVALIKGDNNE